MRISTSTGPKIFEPKEIASSEELASTMLQTNYSLGVYRDNARSEANFLSAEAIGLDFDSGMTLKEAKIAFANYIHIIAPTRNHQKEKHGVVCDRFRVVLFFKQPITDVNQFKATWHTLAQKWPACDPACKDAARFYYPSSSIESIKKKGLRIEPVTDYTTPLVTHNDPESLIKGKLTGRASQFLIQGAPGGAWNTELYYAVRNMYQNHYSEEEIIARLMLMGRKYFSGKLDDNDMTTIRSALRNEPQYAPNLKKNAFTMRKVSDIEAEAASKTWIVDEMLSAGSLGLLSADPKAGKSTLARQLAASILTGTPFLGFNVQQGSVFWMGLEESPRDITSGLRHLGVADHPNLLIHHGIPDEGDNLSDLGDIVTEARPTLVVIDTLFDMVQVKSNNDYTQVREQLSRLLYIAQQSGSHILSLHHNSKGLQDETFRGTKAVNGSSVIVGKSESILVIEIKDGKRYLSITGRAGVAHMLPRELIYNHKTRTSTLGSGEEF